MPEPPTFRPDPELFPFRSRFVQTRRARLHYVDEGEGPPLLLLHGNPTWSFLWREVVRELSGHFRCVAVDYPGFGLSEHPDGYGYTPREHAEAVRELVRRLDLRDLTVFGHDWGGPIGMRIALDERPRIRALIMSNTWYWPAERGRVRAFSRIMSSRPLRWAILRWNLFVVPLMQLATDRRLETEVVDHYRGVFPTRESRRGVAAFAEEILGSSFWLGEIAHAVPRVLRDVPLLLLWGMHDPVFPSAGMRRFRRDFRRVSEVRLKKASHFVPEDDPQRIALAVRRFFRVWTAEEAAARGRDPFGPVGVPPEFQGDPRPWYAPAA